MPANVGLVMHKDRLQGDSKVYVADYLIEIEVSFPFETVWSRYSG
jgi:hypothetical protein